LVLALCLFQAPILPSLLFFSSLLFSSLLFSSLLLLFFSPLLLIDLYTQPEMYRCYEVVLGYLPGRPNEVFPNGTVLSVGGR
jgi:hypothetical protein